MAECMADDAPVRALISSNRFMVPEGVREGGREGGREEGMNTGTSGKSSLISGWTAGS